MLADGQARSEPTDTPSIVRFSSLFAFFTPSDSLLAACAIVSCIAAGVVPLIQVFLLGKIFTKLASYSLPAGPQSGESNSTDLRRDIDRLVVWLVLLGCAAWVINGFTYASWTVLSQNQAQRARRRVLNTLIHRHLSWFDCHAAEDDSTASSYTRHVYFVEQALGVPSSLIIQNLATFLAMMIFAFYKSWKLTAVTIASLPLFALLTILVALPMPPMIKMQQSRLDVALKAASCAFSAINTVKVYNAQHDEYSRFMQPLRESAVYFKKHANVLALQQALMRVGTLSMFIQGTWYGSHLVEVGETTAGDVTATFYAAILGVSAIANLMPMTGYFYQAGAAAQILRNFVHSGPAETSPARISSMLKPHIRGDIRLKNVSFHYPASPDRPILHSIDMHLHAGEMHFIVGMSGSGKTTLGQLLAGMYEITRGSIDIDELPIESICPQWLRKQTHLVEQASTLLLGSVIENLRLANVDRASGLEDTLSDAILFAALDQAVLGLSQGLHTQVGPRGSNLSGGQRQRVALARAYIRSPAVLVLDEFTSAIDPITKDKVIPALRAWRKGLTTIVITHDLDMISAETDYVIVMENGTVTEQGYNKTNIVDRYKLMRGSRLTPNIEETMPPIPPIPTDHLAHRQAALKKLSSRSTRISRVISGPLSPALIGTRGRFTFSENTKSLFEVGWSFEKMLALSSAAVDRFRLRPRSSATPTLSSSGKNIPLATLQDDPPSEVAGMPDKYQTISILRVIQAMIKPMATSQKIRLLLGLLSCVGQAAGTPLFSYFFGKLIGTLFNTSNQSHDALTYSLELLAVICGDAALLYFLTVLMSFSAQDSANGLREAAYRKLLDRARSFFDQPDNSMPILIEALDHHAEQIQSILGRFIGQCTTALLLLLYSLVWSLTIAWKPALASLASVPLVCINAGLVQLLSAKYDTQIVRISEDAEEVLTEVYTSIKTIKLLTLQDHFIQKYDELIARLSQVTKMRAFCCAPSHGFSPALINFLIALLFHLGIDEVFDGEYSTTQMLQVFSLLLFGATGASSIISGLPSLNTARVSAGRILRLAELDETTAEAKGDLQVLKVGDLEFDAVEFSYPSRTETQALKSVSFKINAGSCVAIVGTSGSGKSTVACLLSKLYDPRSKDIGQLPSIFISGQDITRLRTTGLRQLIAVVCQTPLIFPGTVEENIALGLSISHPYAGSDHIKMSAVLAGCDGFIEGLTDGYKTVIGEGGLGLSGGQMQRIAIARAINKRPQLLILDEATSALDRDTASHIRQTISQLTTNKAVWPNLTVIIITHDREMMTLADQVIVMDEGRKVEEGTFDDLLCRNGMFSRLYKGEGFVEEHMRKSMFWDGSDWSQTLNTP